MRLVVGLGNPGPRYERNRHNIGFMAADEIVRRHGFGPWRARFQGQMSEGLLGGAKLLVLKPATFMNDSGRAVGEALRFFKFEPEQVCVIYDELDLAPARLKVKRGGGNGGHNGLRSIDAHIGKDYWRVRIGIGHPGHKDRVSGYVLSDFAKAEWPAFETLVETVARRFDLMAADKASDFMSKVAMDINPPPLKPPVDPKAKKVAAKKAAPKRVDGPPADAAPAEVPSEEPSLADKLAVLKKRFLSEG